MEWTVSKQQVELHPHTNSDNLEIVKVGTAQMVVQKGNYKNGDIVLIITDKSVLPPGIIRDAFDKYLSGNAENRRVKAVRLRGEFSEAITWPLEDLLEAYTDAFNNGFTPSDMTFEAGVWELSNAQIGDNIAHLLGIVKYEPPIPANLSGKVGVIKGVQSQIQRHECYHLASYSDEFGEDERIVVTEKVHGSQIVYLLEATGAVVTTNEFNEINEVVEGRKYREVVTTKNKLIQGIEHLESPTDDYWNGVRNSRLREICQLIGQHFHGLREGYSVQVVGELVPVQNGYSYGFTKPTVLAFDVFLNGVAIAYDEVIMVDRPVPELPYTEQPKEKLITPSTLFQWVPVLYDGPAFGVSLSELAKGKETVSGKELHIREGVVVRPYDVNRRDRKGNIRLHLKVINPRYKGEEDEIN